MRIYRHSRLMFLRYHVQTSRRGQQRCDLRVREVSKHSRSQDETKIDRLSVDYSGSYNLGSPGLRENQSPKKPGIGRRQSSRLMPHRGTTFSVDDASQEIEEPEDLPPRPTGAALRRAHSTLRRRTTATPSALFLAQTVEDDEEAEAGQTKSGTLPSSDEQPRTSEEEGTTQVEDDEEQNLDEEEGDLSDAESFTLRDRQDAINETHPFGIRIWKPALYRKSRSANKGAEGDIHSTPGGQVSRWLWFFNFAWTLVFGWWLALAATAGALVCFCFFFAPGCNDYGHVLWGLARYIFYPFGKYIKLIQDEAYSEEDEGEGRSISEYEQWQSGALEEGRLFFGPAPLVGRRRSDVADDEEETSSLLGRTTARRRMSHRLSSNGTRPRRRLFGRGHWNVGRVLFFLIFWGFLTPLFLFVAVSCWLLVFTLPMARVTAILWDQLRRRPLTIEFHADTTYTRGPGTTPSSILLCTYRATGFRYWKYTIDGTNILLFNLLGIVAFVIFDYWVLRVALGLKIFLTNTIFIFMLSLFSVIPLAYFIGQAVASISAQSTMGVGAAINAFFSTLVEVFLYCVALREGKAQLVEGSIIGSIFAGILLLPGVSMCFGAIKRKTQRFNVKSAGVTTTMLLFATIGAFGPTLFYQIYGAVSIHCGAHSRSAN
jgi:Ca2+:H+ antiporter